MSQNRPPFTKMPNLFSDLETFCETPIANGSFLYAERAEVMLWSYALDDGPVAVWDLVNGTVTREGVEHVLGGRQMPTDLAKALHDQDTLVWFHNGGMFDYPVLDTALPKIAALIPSQRRRDTMVQAFAHGLPGALEKLGAVLGMREEDRKIADGKRLVRLFCQPHTEKDGTVVRHTKKTHPEEWKRFVAYAAGDIVTMREAHRKMPTWNYRTGKQVDLCLLDWKINARGFAVDRELAEAAVRVAAAEKDNLADQVSEATGGRVGAATQRDELLAYILAEHGVELPDMQSDTLERRLDDPDLPEHVKELLRIRLQASRNTAAKFRALLKRVSTDGRLRGCMQFRGASRTGRWAHRAFQPGNLMRPTMSAEMIALAVEAIKDGSVDLIFSNVMEAIGNTVRGAIVAPPGRKLVVADLSNIEGRMAAWLAGEQWKLDAFRAFDEGEGHDLYIVAYAKSFNVDPASVPKKGPERQIGKVEELMFQYGGGVGAWITGAATYGIDLVKMTEQVFPSLPAWAIDEATDFCRWVEDQAAKKVKPLEGEEFASRERIDAAMDKARFGLVPKVFIACDAIKRLWRRAHPQIASYWGELEEGVRYCIDNPGETVTARKVKIRRDGAWLRIMLPSGRYLCYPNPRINKNGEIVFTGLDQYTKRWGDVKTYGGKLCLARGTLVLTEARGWVPIEEVTPVDRVWDGAAWVRTAGCVAKGVKEVIEAHGAWMTPDHEVLTTEGWKRASQSQGHHRAACWLPHGVEVPRQRRNEVPVGRVLFLRPGKDDRSHRTGEDEATRRSSLVWMHEEGHDRRAQHQARDVSAPGVLGVAGHDRPLPAEVTPRLAQLRSAWHQSVQAVGRVFRQLLGRHGAFVPTGAHHRAPEQRQGILTEQLRVGDAQGAGKQQTQQCCGGRALGPNDRGRTFGANRAGPHDDLLQAELGPQGSSADRQTRCVTEVFDLMDCGPQHRFVIAAGGLPLIVHNCENITQAAACDQLAEPMLEIEAAGYETVLTVHDEIVAEVPDTDEFTAERLASMMCMSLGWNEGLPLAAAGFETKRYTKE